MAKKKKTKATKTKRTLTYHWTETSPASILRFEKRWAFKSRAALAKVLGVSVVSIARWLHKSPKRQRVAQIGLQRKVRDAMKKYTKDHRAPTEPVKGAWTATSPDAINAFKERWGITTFKQLARILGVAEGTVNGWIGGTSKQSVPYDRTQRDVVRRMEEYEGKRSATDSNGNGNGGGSASKPTTLAKMAAFERRWSMTKREMANVIGTSDSALYSWAANKNAPSITTLRKAGRAMAAYEAKHGRIEYAGGHAREYAGGDVVHEAAPLPAPSEETAPVPRFEMPAPIASLAPHPLDVLSTVGAVAPTPPAVGDSRDLLLAAMTGRDWTGVAKAYHLLLTLA